MPTCIGKGSVQEITEFAIPIQFHRWEYIQIVEVNHNVLLPPCWLSHTTPVHSPSKCSWGFLMQGESGRGAAELMSDSNPANNPNVAKLYMAGIRDCLTHKESDWSCDCPSVCCHLTGKRPDLQPPCTGTANAAVPSPFVWHLLAD